jgi:hypothetical protein
MAAECSLLDEIKELRKRMDEGDAPRGVTHESVDAIDHVRSIGNIGAHMEKDVNLIVEIDPGEAQALIELIEMLFEEWYVGRKAREDRLAQIAKIGEQKNQERNKGKAGPSPGATEVGVPLRPVRALIFRPHFIRWRRSGESEPRVGRAGGWCFCDGSFCAGRRRRSAAVPISYGVVSARAGARETT